MGVERAQGEQTCLMRCRCQGRHQVRVDRSRDALLTEFGRATLSDRYLMPGEDFQDLFARVASYYGDDQAHAQRIYDYMSQAVVHAGDARAVERRHPARPADLLLSERGVGQPRRHRRAVERERLAGVEGRRHRLLLGQPALDRRKGGRSRQDLGRDPVHPGDGQPDLAISQGSLRRGSAAVYLPVWHPEIEEFVEIRRPTGGDPNRKALNLHHGILVSDAFMRAVEADEPWTLVSPKDNAPVRTISARALWVRILTARIETGEPYLIFSDHVNRARPEHHKLAGLEVKTSNLCSEITLPTGIDQHGKQRTAVCCLSVAEPGELVRVEGPSAVHRGRDAVPRQRAAGFHRARAAGDGAGEVFGDARAQRGAGRDGLPLVPAIAGRAVGERDRQGVEQADVQAHPRAGRCREPRCWPRSAGRAPDAAEYGIMERFSHKMSIAPTASISIIAGNSSPGIEPIAANVFLQKTLSGSFSVRNRHLQSCWRRRGRTMTRYGRRSR